MNESINNKPVGPEACDVKQQSALNRLSDCTEKELDGLTSVLATLLERLEPLRNESKTPERPKGTTEQMSALCSRIGRWSDRIRDMRLYVEDVLSELEI